MAKVSHNDKRIAIVGMAVQYAGSRDKDEFWQTLMAKECKAKKISDNRLGTKYRDMHYSPHRSKYADTFCNEKYGCIDEDVNSEHELLLKLAKTALDDARQKRPDGKDVMDRETAKRCGIVSGCLSFPMDNLQGEFLNLVQNHMEKKLGADAFVDADDWSERKASKNPNGLDKTVFADPASFVAEELGLGPLHYVVDAACASALYVLRLAQDHLVSGAADVMLCGATCFPEPFFILSGFSTFQAMPLGENGISYPLHNTSQGLTPGEGGSIMVLKRLEDAVRDGDHIYGTLLGASISNAGCGLPLAPHMESERQCMMDTYTRIGKDAKSVQYVECHATGTPQGDRVEVKALSDCFQGGNIRFGSTKGNFGHTLVAAGFAGMCKVLLSMERGVIPPTPGVDETNKIDDRVVTETIAWPDTKGDLKRAGLSAFGFGGTDAHAVFEEFSKERYLCENGVVNPLKLRSLSATVGSGNMKVAIVGMDATFGSIKGLDEFERAIYNGQTGASDLPEKRWRIMQNDKEFLDVIGLDKAPRGCFIENVEVDFKRLRTPMIPEDMLRCQQLLAVTTIDRALMDSGIKKGGHVAVLVGLGTELELYRHRCRVALKERLHPSIRENKELLDKMMCYVNDCGTSTSYTSYIGNLVATRVASQWGFTGPAFTITEGNNSVYRCTELAKYLLETGEVEAVVVAGVDLCASAESYYVKSRRFNLSKADEPNASFEKNADGVFLGEGCGALVLKRFVDCKQDKKIYACIDAIASGLSPGRTAQAALGQVDNASPEMIELSADSARHTTHPDVLDENNTAETEVAQLGKVVGAGRKNAVAVGSVKANVGDVGYASGAASLIKTALCLYNRYLPVNPRWEAPSESLEWADTLYTCENSKAWLKNANETRYAMVSGVSESRSCYSLVMSDVEGHHETSNRISLDEAAPKLVIITGESHQEIVQKVSRELAGLLEKTGSSAEKESKKTRMQRVKLERDSFYRLLGESLKQPTGKLVLCLVTTPQKLHRELELAQRGIERFTKLKKDWVSPSGSCYSPSPLSSDKIAFMYGEGRSPYFGVGLDLHRIWPGFHEMTNKKISDFWGKDDSWWQPRASSVDELQVEKDKFFFEQVEMFRTGCFMSLAYTEFAQQQLGIKPKGAFGLSLGEISMLFAFSDKNLAASNALTCSLRTSAVWNTELAVEFNSIRKAWGVPQDAPLESFWQGYILHGTRTDIERAIGDEKFVRLLIINDDRSALIAGKPENCQHVIQRLGSKLPSFPVTQGLVGHCPEVLPYVNEISKMHRVLEIPPNPTCELYTSVTNSKLSGRNAEKSDKVYAPSIGEFTSKLYSGVADFPAIVKAVNQADHDVFIEVGSDCARSLAVKSILGPNISHVSVALDKQSEKSWNQVLKSVAVLCAHKTPGLSIENLYHPKLIQRAMKAASETGPEKPNKFLRMVGLNEYFVPTEQLLPPSTELPSAPESIRQKVENRKMQKVQLLPNEGGGKVKEELRPKENSAIPVLKDEQPASLLEKVAQLDLAFSIAGDRTIYPCTPSTLGSKGFLKTYGVEYPMYAGAMAKGIASADMVIAAGQAKILASFGAGGLPIAAVRQGLEKIQRALPSGPYAVNLIHSPFEDLEKANVDLFLEKGVRVVEASAFMSLTPQLVRYRCCGLEDGGVVKNRLIAKLSRTELAEMFLRPAPERILQKLVASGEITPKQAALARMVPLADDIAVEADSGGHTDNRPIHVLLPLIIQLRNRIHKECNFADNLKVRVGAGGGIGCPSAAIAAFDMGAAFVLTGTINQLTRQAGTCDYVRTQLAGATYSDVTMAPAADMFDQGVELQVLKKGTMFAARAKKLYELFLKYPSLEAIPKVELDRLEKRTFKQSVEQIWQETKEYYINRLHNPDKIKRAEKDGKLKLSLVFRWYLSKSSRWANDGVQGRTTDYQIWCGPAIGSFNDFIAGTYLDKNVSGVFPCVQQVSKHIIHGACYHQRLNQLRMNGIDLQDDASYKPSTPF
eukprot:CAMPEP_0203753802 /NCGR_PEP_ID=MMETSP0098-20131031/7505_1 /ASSEMBLY_ACC=CAM_ASM_000208 /TAXON_ID=96639 /ORGANISM=" , Strain NY0313808BC1" /LENGTH=1992 /DNA_ID=CAMNT_0050644557 /DNA_START=38 /DNA_END=6016 /DNA_ORIENTATION=+